MREMGEDENPGDSNCSQKCDIKHVGKSWYHPAGSRLKTKKTKTCFKKKKEISMNSMLILLTDPPVSTGVNEWPQWRHNNPPNCCCHHCMSRWTPWETDTSLGDLQRLTCAAFFFHNFSPGPVSQVEGNWWTLGWLVLSYRRDSPIHQKGLSPNSILREKCKNTLV